MSETEKTDEQVLSEQQQDVARSILREGARLQRLEILNFLGQYSGKALDVDELMQVIKQIDSSEEVDTEEVDQEE